MENSLKILKKLKTQLLYDSTILLLNIYSKEMNLISQRDICMPMFIAYTIAKTWKQSKWLQKVNGERKCAIRIHSRIYSALEKKKILPCATT